MSTLFTELKRRNVFKVGVAYLALGWVVLQVTAMAVPAFGMPEVVNTVVFFLGIIGFPFALFFAWAFELTPDGVKPTSEIDPKESIAATTGQKLNYVLLPLLLIALFYMLYERQSSDIETAIAESHIIDASIAVLPFDDLSSASDQEYFADGLSEEILNVLVGVDSFRVASRTSSFQFKGDDNIGIPEIATKLNVSFILEGSVRKAGNTLRITAQLIEAHSDRHLWSETFDRELSTENIFAIQDEIATKIVALLSKELNLDASANAIEVKTSTDNLSAYEAFLKGREKFLGRASLADVKESIELLKNAIKIDPKFAQAWLFYGAVNSVAPSWSVTEANDAFSETEIEGYLSEAEKAAQKALQLDPSLGFAHAVLAQNRKNQVSPDWDFSIASYQKALALEPKNATIHLWLANEYKTLGYFDLAEEQLTKCLTIDPLYYNCYVHTEINQAWQGKIAQAQKTLEKMLEIWPTRQDTTQGYYQRMARQLIVKGDILMGHWLINLTVPNVDKFPVNAWITAIQNPERDHSEVIQQVEAWFETVSLALAYKQWLYLSLEAWDRVPIAKRSIENLPFWYPEFAGYRKSENFKANIRSLNIDDYWRKYGFPPQCRSLGDDDFEC